MNVQVWYSTERLVFHYLSHEDNLRAIDWSKPDLERYILPKRIYCFVKAVYWDNIFFCIIPEFFINGRKKSIIQIFLKAHSGRHSVKNEGQETMSWEGGWIIPLRTMCFITRVTSLSTLLIKQENGSQGTPIQYNINNLQGDSYTVVLFYTASLLRRRSLNTSLVQTL